MLLDYSWLSSSMLLFSDRWRRTREGRVLCPAVSKEMLSRGWTPRTDIKKGREDSSCLVVNKVVLHSQTEDAKLVEHTAFCRGRYVSLQHCLFASYIPTAVLWQFIRPLRCTKWFLSVRAGWPLGTATLTDAWLQEVEAWQPSHLRRPTGYETTSKKKKEWVDT